MKKLAVFLFLLAGCASDPSCPADTEGQWHWRLTVDSDECGGAQNMEFDGNVGANFSGCTQEWLTPLDLCNYDDEPAGSYYETQTCSNDVWTIIYGPEDNPNIWTGIAGLNRTNVDGTNCGIGYRVEIRRTSR